MAKGSPRPGILFYRGTSRQPPRPRAIDRVSDLLRLSPTREDITAHYDPTRGFILPPHSGREPPRISLKRRSQITRADS